MKNNYIKHKKLKNILALLGLVSSLFFAYCCYYGWQNHYNKKSVVIIFFFLALLPFTLSLCHIGKSLYARSNARREDIEVGNKKKENAKTIIKADEEEIKEIKLDAIATLPAVTPTDTEEVDNSFSLSYYDVPEDPTSTAEEKEEDDSIPGQLFLDLELSLPDGTANVKVIEKEPELSAPIEHKTLISTDVAPRMVDQRSKGVWWDKKLLEHCEKSFPKLDFKQPQGRTMLGTKWFIVPDDAVAKDELEKYQREIEHRGGKIVEVLQSIIDYALVLSEAIPDAIEKDVKLYSKISVLSKEDFSAIKTMGDSVKEENRWMFTPQLMFKVVEKALTIEQEEDGVKYIFLAPDGEGFSAVYLDKNKEKKKIIWDGNDIIPLWNECGETLENYVIVTPSPKYLENFKKRVEDASLKCKSLKYIDLIRWEQIFFAHESIENLKNLGYVCQVLGMEAPKDESELANAVASIFMLFITDNNGYPKGQIVEM